MIGGASGPPPLVSQGSPSASKMSQGPLQDMLRGLSRVWLAAEEQLIGERKRVVDIALVAVTAAAAVAVVVADPEAVVGPIEPSNCWKERLVSFSVFGHARPSLGQADVCTNPSHFRPPSLQEQNMS